MTTQNNPLGYALTVGLTSASLLPNNPSRRGLMFFNPSGNTVWICPSISNTGVALVAAINGAGSIQIVPGGTLVLPQPGMLDPGIGAAFNAISSGASTPFTVWEF